MAAAIALGERGRGRTGTNPSIGCIIVRDGRIIGRGWTQPGGRPHAEAMALAEAGAAANGAAAYVSLEPCAHESERGPACTDALITAKLARVVGAVTDPDPRTEGRGYERLAAAGIIVDKGVLADEAKRSLKGFLTRITNGRPHVTLKLATSLDGCIAMADGSSRWITGDAARAHTHLERARTDAILVGAGTMAMDKPRLDVRLPGLEDRSPSRIILGKGKAPAGWAAIRSPEEIIGLGYNSLLVEGGAQTATSFLKAGLVDRLLLYRAPIIIGAGKPCLGDIGLSALGNAHGQWLLTDSRALGKDRMEVYEAACSQA
jgi:diaminohydroxyphosphoribosylaminopyrimidine deaminase / 5-amino-6-(5-phosphoribosylamino)uracil reductase